MLKSRKSSALSKRKSQETEKLKEFEKDKKHLIDYLLQQGILSKESLNLNEKTTQVVYEKAYQLYASGHYAKAKSLFAVLVACYSSNFQFLYGYATCCFMLKEYEIAADCYARCSLLDSSNPLPYFYAADCYIYLRDLLSACTALKLVVKKASDYSEYAEIKHRAQLILDALLTAKTPAKTQAHSS